MLSKLLIPSALKLSGLRTFTSLTRAAATRTNTVRSLSNREIRPRILHDLKISPYAFLHTQSSVPTLAAELVKEETKEETIEQEVEPIVAQPKRFDALETIHPFTQKAIQRIFKYNEMSSVQEAVLNKLPNETDMFVKAKTGTGKTLAFLIAAIQTAFGEQKITDMKHFEGASIMVISPTRELANQIAEEAHKLTSFYPFKVHCFVGGDSKRRQIMNIQRNRCDIIVATPGRLQDMLSSVPHFKKMCENLKVLVLDEADQLLDMGFKAELQRILDQIPEKRQTMLYSATISREIRRDLGQFALSKDYELIDTVGENDVNTNLQVKQSYVVAPYNQQLSMMRDILQEHEAAQTGKTIVFLPTTKSTMVFAQIFRQLMPDRTIYEIHSKKAQDQRSKIADRFRKARPGSILFTSDVSARGVDYPGVSFVLQVGVPSSREQYIHRLGRTGRAGRDGEGAILLAPFEKTFVERDLRDLPVTLLERPAVSEQEAEETNLAVTRAINGMDEDMVREVYTAYLGYYAGRLPMLGKPKSVVLDEARNFMNGLGITEVPHLSPRFLQQIGLGGGGGSGGSRGGFSRDRRDGSSSRGGFNSDRRGSYNNRDRSDSFGSRGGFNSDRRDSYSNRDRNDSFGSRDNYSKRDSFGGDKDRGSFNKRRDFDSDNSSGFKSRDFGSDSSSGFKSRDSSSYSYKNSRGSSSHSKYGSRNE